MSWLDKIEARVPRLDAMGPHFFASFPVRKLPDPSLLWFNERWFVEQGVDIYEPEIRRCIESDLLDRFGVISERSAGEIGVSSGAAGILYADRYGGSSGTIHGGSGRCGVSGPFNAKGIGCTPLVAEDAGWVHSHGSLWLGDAIREAIDAEVAAAEAPHGGVPVIAIIDSGIRGVRPDGNSDTRRAIAVRPNFVRPAHLERSILFGTAGTIDSPQYRDAQRTRDAIRALCSGQGGVMPDGSGFGGVTRLFTQIATHIGHGRANRLWCGPIISSNASIDGALVDFGSFRAVPSWRKLALHGYQGEAFGEDTRRVGDAIDSICTYFRKYAPTSYSVPDAATVRRSFESELGKAFVQCVVEVLPFSRPNPEGAERDLLHLLLRYYQTQQRETVYVGRPGSRWRRPWIFDFLYLRDGDFGHLHFQDRAMMGQLRLLLRQIGMGSSTGPQAEARFLSAMRRWLRPRPTLYRDFGNLRATRLTQNLSGDPQRDHGTIDAYVRKMVGRSRRIFRGMPGRHCISAFATDLVTRAFYCRNLSSGEPYLVIEAPCLAAEVVIFGRRVGRDDLPADAEPAGGNYVRLQAEPLRAAGGGVEVALGGRRIPIPDPVVAYE